MMGWQEYRDDVLWFWSEIEALGSWRESGGDALDFGA